LIYERTSLNTTDALGTNALAAATRLSKTVNFADISLNKSYALLGKTIDVSKGEDSSDDEGGFGGATRHRRSRYAQDQASKQSSSAQRQINKRKLLLRQSKTFRDFENLFVALSALEDWKYAADEAATKLVPLPCQSAAHADLLCSIDPILLRN